jgi:hypothetical protein
LEIWQKEDELEHKNQNLGFKSFWHIVFQFWFIIKFYQEKSVVKLNISSVNLLFKQICLSGFAMKILHEKYTNIKYHFRTLKNFEIMNNLRNRIIFVCFYRSYLWNKIFSINVMIVTFFALVQLFWTQVFKKEPGHIKIKR